MPTVRDILDRKGGEVASIRRELSVIEAAKEMNRLRIGSLVVVDGPKVVGMFTERDILVRVVAEARDPNRITVGQIMTTPVVCVGPETDLAECKSIVTSRRIRHIPVIEGGKLVGIVTSGDIMARESREHEVTIESLVEYIGGPAPLQPL
jgi:CBS domain-containing protein